MKSNKNNKPDKNSLLPVRRALRVIRLSVENPEGISFSRLKDYLSPVSPGILSRLLKSLISEHVLNKNTEGLYVPGDFLRDLSFHLKPCVDLRSAVSYLIKILSSETGFSAAYFELRDRGLFLLAKSEVAEGFHYIEPEQAMGNIPGNVFSQIVIAFGGKRVIHSLGLSKSIFKDKSLSERICEIRKGKSGFFDSGTSNQIFRIGAAVFCKGKILGVAGISTYGGINDKKLLNKINILVSKTAKKIGEIYESNNGNV